MILKGSQRGGGRQLAAHLLNARDNEHVAVHELRGFASSDLRGAFQEVEAVSRGTKARQYLFSLSFNPPSRERVTVEEFEQAVDAAERRLGLAGQPRAIVFHEKDGRRHAHAVWSRIDVERMKAINLPHFKRRLQEVSRALYREHGWAMPRGLANGKDRDPRTFTRGEWEQAKRAGQDPKALKAMFQECWVASSTGPAYAKALAGRGYTLAAGDRRAIVAVDCEGKVYALAKWTGLRVKQMRDKLAALKDLPGVDQARAANTARMSEALRGFIADAETARAKNTAALALQRTQLVEQQRKDRADLAATQEQRWAKETALRAARLNKGLRGLWDRLTGRQARQVKENEREAFSALRRDRGETDAQIERHLREREAFHVQARQQRQAHARDVEQLHRDIAAYGRDGAGVPPRLSELSRGAGRRERERGPALERE